MARLSIQTRSPMPPKSRTRSRHGNLILTKGLTITSFPISAPKSRSNAHRHREPGSQLLTSNAEQASHNASIRSGRPRSKLGLPINHWRPNPHFIETLHYRLASFHLVSESRLASPALLGSFYILLR